MMKILKILSILFFAVFAFSMNAVALTCTTQFTGSGDEDGSIILTADLTSGCNCGTLNSMTISAFDADGNCGSWYDFDITVDGTGGGTTISTCNFGITIPSDATTITISGNDLDSFLDGVSISIDVTYDYTDDGSCPPDPCASGAADDCNNATPLDLTSPFMGTTDCGYTVDNEPASFCGSVDNNSWFSFVAGATDVVIDWDITGGSNCASGIQLAVYEGTCGSLSLVGSNCVSQTGGIGSDGTFTMSGLTVGNTYLLMIDGFGGNLCDYSITPVGGVAITPDNDDCANATTITCGSTTTSDNVLATAGDAPGACGTAGGAGAGIWYTFAGDGSNVTLSTDAAGTSFDTELTVWTGSCGALTCLAGDDDGGTGTTSEVTFTSTNGTVYYVYVSGAGGATGAFELSLTCVTPVTGDACTDPITVPVALTSGTPCTPAQVVDLSAFTNSLSPEEIPISCSTIEPGSGDVWFDITLPASGQATFLTDQGGNGNVDDTWIEVYETTCDGTEVSCQDGDAHATLDHEILTLTGTAGDVVRLRVGATNTQTSGLLGDFAVCAYDPVVPATDVSLSIADPCDCTNKIVVGGGEYAQEVITITPGAAPYTVTAIAGLYTAAGVLYTPATATSAIVSGATITLTGYVPADNTATYNITVQDGNSSTDSISGGPCASCCAADNGVWQP